MRKYVLILCLFLSVNALGSDPRFTHYAQLQCFEPFVKDGFFRGTWKQIKAGLKDYAIETREFGIKRIFVKPHRGEPVGQMELEKWRGLLFKDPDYANIRWYMEPERIVFQAVPRKLTKWTTGQAMEFSSFRMTMNKLERKLTPGGWQLSIPSTMVITLPPTIAFWTLIYQGTEVGAERFTDWRKTKQLKELLENNYRFKGIKSKLDEGIYDEELALMEAESLINTYKIYFQTMKEFKEHGYNYDSLEVTATIISDETYQALFGELFQRTFSYTKKKFWNRSYFEYTSDKEIDEKEMHNLMVLGHKKIMSAVSIEELVRKLANGKVIEEDFNAGFLDNEFTQELLNLRRKGLSDEKLLYWLTDDLDWQVRLAEWEVLGVKAKNPTDGRNVYIDMNYMRNEALNKIHQELNLDHN